MWDDAWGPRMQHILRNALLALPDLPEVTLPDLLRLLGSKEFRTQALRHVQNEQVRAFWQAEFPRYSLRYQAEAIAPIQNKAGAFLADPALRRILTRTDGRLRLRRILDDGQVLLVNLAKGKLGADSAGLFGGLLVTSLGLAAFSRAAAAEAARRPFYLYIDEFQTFPTLALADLLSELRKFGIGAVLAHQYLHQLDPDIRHAVIGNAGTLIAFRLGGHDARLIAREFEPVFDRTDLLALPNHALCLKLMIDGAPSAPFSATSLHPRDLPPPYAPPLG
jgi:hypothetical protein